MSLVWGVILVIVTLKLYYAFLIRWGMMAVVTILQNFLGCTTARSLER